FCFPATSPTELYTLSLHDALPICTTTLFIACPLWADHPRSRGEHVVANAMNDFGDGSSPLARGAHNGRLLIRGRCSDCGSSPLRSEEHTSELQSRENLVCRLLLEK